MASVSLWYARYVGDYQRKTSHLSLLEHGVYTLLLDHYYSTGRPLPANAEQLQRICRTFADAEKAALQVVLSEYFTLEADGYHNSKADEELVKRSELSEKRRKAANLKGSKCRANAPANAPANAEQLQTHLHPHIDSVLRTDAAASSVTDDLKTRIFGPALDWLTKQANIAPASARRMLGKWCKDYGDGRTLEALQAAAKNSPLDPIPYIQKVIRNGKSTNGFNEAEHNAAILAAVGLGGMDTGGTPPSDGDEGIVIDGDFSIDASPAHGRPAGHGRSTQAAE